MPNVRSILSALARAVRHVAGVARGASREAGTAARIARDDVYTGPRLCTACEGYTEHVPWAVYEEWLATGFMPCPCGDGVLAPVLDEEAVR